MIPLSNVLSVFLKPTEKVNIKEDHLALLTTQFPLVVCKENTGKLQEELLDCQIANETELPKKKMMKITNIAGLIHTGSKYHC